VAKSEIPSFECEKTHEAKIGGRVLVFHAVSGPVLLRLQQKLGPAFAKLLLALRTRQDAKAAAAELLEAAGGNPQLVGELVLDALHDEDWVERPVKPRIVDEFLQKTSGPALLRMLAAVATVNAVAFLPSVPELLEAFAAAVSGEIPDASDEPSSASSSDSAET
jgi:hypothetical protein